MEVTGSFVYIRLRELDYSDANLDRRAKWLSFQEKEVFLHMKHDDGEAPLLAQRLAAATGPPEAV